MIEILYNILWIDDEHEGLSSTKGQAKSKGINLIGFKSLNAGISELEKNLHFYDGVLLDAKFYENEDDISGSEDTDNIHRAKETLLQLNKKFEIFVLTGQAEAFEDRTFNKSFKRVYKKGSSEERDRLFDDIKLSADNQEDTQIRHKFKRVFEVCTERYIGDHVGQDLIYLLKVDDETNIESYFIIVRKIVEDIFSGFNKFNLLPKDFVFPKVALNESSKFLAGKYSEENYFIEKGFRHLDETHLPIQIASNLRSILSVTQANAHRSEIDSYVKMIKTPYLLQSVLFQLLDVIIWFKMYVNGNPKTENWERIESTSSIENSVSSNLVKGIVIEKDSLARKGKDFAFFKPETLGDNIIIPSHLVSRHSLQDEMKIHVEIEEYMDNRANEKRNRVKRIEL